MNKSKPFMAIDPSINTMGVAFYDKKELIAAELWKPEKEFKQSEHYIKTGDMVSRLMERAILEHVQHVILEVPEYWGADGFVARESGSIAKMMFLCGGLYCRLIDLGIEMRLVSPRQWKGQLPKNVVRNRLERVFVPNYYTKTEWKDLDHNVMDAVAIGHFHITGRV